MDRRIFEMEMSVEATSLYLLLASLNESGGELGVETVSPIWNSTPDNLTAAVKELKERGVLSGGAKGPWSLLPAAGWLFPAPPEV
ncbi:MAG: hypothetical protein KQJ78_24115 [Deltaproteobacteria bacterium]|nr:hypothetical protein [Deltaproteobacteria bacterium]